MKEILPLWFEAWVCRGKNETVCGQYGQHKWGQFKGTQAWDFRSLGSFMNKIVHRPLSNTLKYVGNFFFFEKLFMKKGFFWSHFRVRIAADPTISGFFRGAQWLVYFFDDASNVMEIEPAFLPFGQFPGIVTGKFQCVQFGYPEIINLNNFWVKIPGDFSTSG